MGGYGGDVREPRIYGKWFGRPQGHPEDPERCITSVYTGHGFGSTQCKRKRGFGPDGLQCKQHDPEAIEKKADASRAKWNAEMQRNEQRQNHLVVGARLLDSNPKLYASLLEREP